jgi:predicted small secreted protein
MKEIKKLIAIIGIALLCSTTLFSCKNSSKNAEGNGQSDNIAPSDADETRYNLSEQQKMSMQKDTTLLDTAQKDSTTGVKR